jgi:DNA repair photolyase
VGELWRVPFAGRPFRAKVPVLPPFATASVASPGPPAPYVRSICEHLFVRWDNLTISSEEGHRLPGYSDAATIRTFDAPEALDVRFYEVRARSALNRVPKRSRMPFAWTVNPYRGCTHACVFCFARPTHTYLDMNAGRDFEREIVVKVNAPELLRRELQRPSWKREHVALGTNTDPYQWVEGRYRLMPGIWEALRDSATPCSILTKSPLLLRDKELLLDVQKRAPVAANLSVPTLDEGAWRETEPHTPSPRARLEAVAELNGAGIPTGVLIAPLMPGINDRPEEVERIIELAADAGAVDVGGVALHLRGEVKGIFFDWLADRRPDLLPRYRELYRRGAYAPTEERKRLQTLVKRGRRRAGAARSLRGVDPAGPEGDEGGARPKRSRQPERAARFRQPEGPAAIEPGPEHDERSSRSAAEEDRQESLF